MKPFEILMLHGRPAAGKSETIDFLKKLPREERIEKYHIGDFKVLDDFPILWAWFEEDAIRDQLGHPRINSTDKGYFKYEYQWDVLVEKLCLDYKKAQADNPTETTIIEFSRGTQHGGYTRAYKHISEEILKKCAILYIEVSFEESMMKNTRRKNPDRLHSILEHSVDEEKMKNLYEFDDFRDFSKENSDYIEIKGHKVPYVIFENHDDVTTNPGPVMENRLQQKLHKLYNSLAKK